MKIDKTNAQAFADGGLGDNNGQRQEFPPGIGLFLFLFFIPFLFLCRNGYFLICLAHGRHKTEGENE